MRKEDTEEQALQDCDIWISQFTMSVPQDLESAFNKPLDIPLRD